MLDLCCVCGQTEVGPSVAGPMAGPGDLRFSVEWAESSAFGLEGLYYFLHSVH